MRNTSFLVERLLTLSMATFLPVVLQFMAHPAGAEGLDKIGPRMRKFMEAKQISGAVTLVAHRGETAHLEAVGLADITTGRPMSRDSLFAIASMTKPVTATAVLMLQDQGKLSVADPVAKYIPAFGKVALKSGPPERALTLRDLLTHTSGLSGSQKCEGSLKDTAEALATRTLQFEPGTKWQYSPGLNVCGRIVEIVSGQAFDMFLAEHIFNPLGMSDTTFNPSEEQQKRLALIVEPGKDKQSLASNTKRFSEIIGRKVPSPSGGLFSTASDMAKFYLMILNGGELNGRRIVSKAAVKQMTTVQTGDLVTGFTPGNGWGLGWCVVREPQGVTAMLSPGTFGHGGAFGTQGWVDPRTQTIFVLMIQRTKFGNSDASDIRRAFQELAVDGL